MAEFRQPLQGQFRFGGTTGGQSLADCLRCGGHVRYITRAPERSAMRARLNQALVQLLHQQGVDEKSGVPAAR